MSENNKLSPWFGGHIKPVNIGFYQVVCKAIWDSQSWSYWNGKNWTPQNCSGIEYAMLHINSNKIENQNKFWRGIVK